MFAVPFLDVRIQIDPSNKLTSTNRFSFSYCNELQWLSSSKKPILNVSQVQDRSIYRFNTNLVIRAARTYGFGCQLSY